MSTGIRSPLIATALLTTLLGSSHACGAGTPVEQQAAASAASTIRYRADPARNRVWALSAEGASVRADGAQHSIYIPLPNWQWVSAAYASRPDLALAPDGAALVTSNVVPTLWRIDPLTLAVTEHRIALDADTDKDVGFSALVYSPRHATYFAVSDVHGSLWKIDPGLRTAQKINVSTSQANAHALQVAALQPELRIARGDALCLAQPPHSRTIRIARDQRSAHVSAVSCNSTTE